MFDVLRSEIDDFEQLLEEYDEDMKKRLMGKGYLEKEHHIMERAVKGRSMQALTISTVFLRQDKNIPCNALQMKFTNS